MVLPQPFSTTVSPTLSLSFTDLITGQGYVKFYCFDTLTSSGSTPRIISQIINTANGSTSGSSLEFSSTFNQTATMEGIAFIKMHWGYRSNGAAMTGHITLSFQKNGTEFATVDSPDLSTTVNAHNVEYLEVTLPKTSFKRTDVFSIECTITYTVLPGGLLTDWIAHDPENNSTTPGGVWTGGAVTETEFINVIPFNI